MKVEIEMEDRVCHKWWPVAKFEMGTHAMEAARALSVATERRWRVIDRRWPDENPMAVIYENGVAS